MGGWPSTTDVEQHYSDVSDEESVSDTEVEGSTEVESPEEPSEFEEAESKPQVAEDEVFFDNKKVPPELQATHREMQRAWTQKLQEIAPLRKIAEQYGGAEAVVDFVTQFSTPEGVIGFWLDVAERLGLTREQVESLLEGGEAEQPGAQQPVNEQGEPQYLTAEQAQQLFEQQLAEQERRMQAQARMQQESQELEDALKEFEVPDSARRAVLAYAWPHPRHLPVRERIRRGANQWRKTLEEHASSRQQSRESRGKAPASMRGTAPVERPKPAKSLDEARNRAEKRLAALDSE